MIKPPAGAMAAGATAILAIAGMTSAGCENVRPSDPSPVITAAGYVVPWDDRSVSFIGSGVLASVSPVWFQPTDAGGVVFASPEAEASMPGIVAEASGHGIEVIPTISNFRNDIWDGDLIRTIVGDRRLRERHISAVVDLVRANGWPGIDLDYESLPTASRAAYSAFVRDLATAVHAAGARLTVTVHAKTSEPGTWSGARAQDWRALGRSADQVRVMAYDYSSADSPPGAIAPLSWVEQVLRLAVTLVPRERIVLGLGTYGYDWAAGQPGLPLQWADVRELESKPGVAESWDAATESPWLRYSDGRGRSHTVWYENARSAARKIDIARRLGVTRVVLWRLGGEDPGIWDALRSAR